MSALTDRFATARAEGRAALIGYLPAGFPTRAGSFELIEAMVAGGVDIVEVGLPYSDPLMDGPVIQRAVETALAAGTTTNDVLRLAGAAAETGAVSLVMTYWNPIEQYGPERFARQLAEEGGVGVITPDLTPEEADPWVRATDEYGIDRIFVAAPSSTDERLDRIAGISSGFIYAASIMGVTGARTSVSSAAAELVARLRPRTALPIAVGLGVSTGEQAAEVAEFADGVIVGSAFIRAAQDAGGSVAAAAAVRKLAEELAAGVRGA